MVTGEYVLSRSPTSGRSTQRENFTQHLLAISRTVAPNIVVISPEPTLNQRSSRARIFDSMDRIFTWDT